jgi:hypothetical protein
MLAAIDMLADVSLRVNARAIGGALVSLVAVGRDVTIGIGEALCAHVARRHAARVAHPGSDAGAVASAVAATVSTAIAAAVTSALRKCGQGHAGHEKHRSGDGRFRSDHCCLPDAVFGCNGLYERSFRKGVANV